MKLGEAVYKSQQKTAGKADNSKDNKDNKENKDKDNVVDADFEDVKKEDKEKRA
jgi:molecular chaperone DnaK